MSGYERRSTSAVKSFFHAILSLIFGLALIAVIIGIGFIIIKDQEKRETIESFHTSTIEYKKDSDRYYIYVRTEENELIELKVSSNWKDMKIGDTIVYKKTEEYITEDGVRRLLKVTYDY